MILVKWLILFFIIKTRAIPTLYEHYSEDGIITGLSDDQSYFLLNGKNITIYSGAFHYFRVPRAYWRDRLRKMRAIGLNAVETYVPWNLHEYQSGVFDFGNGGSDMEDFLHIEEFLKTAQEEDLFVLMRPGPYICAEWEFGGLPSWIVRNTNSVRTSHDENYIRYVSRYFSVLLPLLAEYQFQNNGSIIVFQLENEYGETGEDDKEYLSLLKQLFIDNGIKELLCTADPPDANGTGALPGVLQTANFITDPTSQLDALNSLQSDKPSMAMEYRPVGRDYWLEYHQTVGVARFTSLLKEILNYPASVNMYMFVGSTNFGFLSGSNIATFDTDNSGLRPSTTSYDYDSPITEYGVYTETYFAVKEVITEFNKFVTQLPDPPEVAFPMAYSTITVDSQLLLSTIINNFENKISSEDVIPMEDLPINNNSGQSYGYIVYRKTNLTLPANAELKISGYIRDTIQVLVNGNLVSGTIEYLSDIDGFGFWRLKNSTLILTEEELEGTTLDLIVHNFGRNNYGHLGQFRQFKGLTEPVYINDEQLKGWDIIPLEFKKSQNMNLQGWSEIGNDTKVPALYKCTLTISEKPKDTFVDMEGWHMGIVIVNGFVLGRYFFLGPQQSLYLPAPLLVEGDNDIIIFEHYWAPEILKFSATPIYGNVFWYK